MSDPRQEERQQLRETDASRLERVQLHLSPTDDGLPVGMAIRYRDEMKRNCSSFGERIRKHRKGAE